VVRGGHCSGTPAFPCLRECALFILVADVHRRVAPIETSLEWLLLFASHQNVIKFERDARPRLASKPSHQHSNSPCGHCGNRCPKCAADIGAHLLFPARPLNRSFTEPTQGEQPLWVGIDARAMTDRVEHSTFPVGFKLGAPRGLLLQVCHGASRKVSTIAQLDDDSLPQQWQSNRSVRSLFHDGSDWRVLTVRIASLEVRKGRLHLSGRHRRMTVFAHLRRLSDVSNRREADVADRGVGRLMWAGSALIGTASERPESERPESEP
jgi:hypothetical protein